MYVFVVANFLVDPAGRLQPPVGWTRSSMGWWFPGCEGDSTPPRYCSSSPSSERPWHRGSCSSSSRTSSTSGSPRGGSTTSGPTPFIGSLVVVFAASSWWQCLPPPSSGPELSGHFTDALGVAHGLHATSGHGAGAIFAIILLNSSIIGAAAVTLSTSYAFGDVFGARHSLHRSWRDAKLFYGTFSGMVVSRRRPDPDPRRSARADHDRRASARRRAAPERHGLPPAALQRPGRARAMGQQAVAQRRGCRHRLGPAHMSLVLMATTLFSTINVRVLTLVLGAALLVGYAVGGVLVVRARRRRPPAVPVSAQRRDTWRMPPLSLLDRPKWSRGRLVGMYLLRGYLVVAVLLLAVKAVELGLHK